VNQHKTYMKQADIEITSAIAIIGNHTFPLESIRSVRVGLRPLKTAAAAAIGISYLVNPRAWIPGAIAFARTDTGSWSGLYINDTKVKNGSEGELQLVRDAILQAMRDRSCGKNIVATDTTGDRVDTEDGNTVSIFAKNQDALEVSVREVETISADVIEGTTYEGIVAGITPFGAFVEVLPGKEGLVHISELANFRVNKVEDICKVGDPMTVKCIGIDERGRIRLSRRAAMVCLLPTNP